MCAAPLMESRAKKKNHKARPPARRAPCFNGVDVSDLFFRLDQPRVEQLPRRRESLEASDGLPLFVQASRVVSPTAAA